MMDNKSALEQAKEFQKIVDAIIAVGMNLDLIFHINMLISWLFILTRL